MASLGDILSSKTAGGSGGFDWRGLVQRVGPNLAQMGSPAGAPAQEMQQNSPPLALVAPPSASTVNPDLIQQIKMLMAQRKLGPAPAQTQGEARTSVGSTLTGGY